MTQSPNHNDEHAPARPARRARLGGAAVAALACLLALTGSVSPAQAARRRLATPLGGNLVPLSPYDRDLAFVDAMKTAGRFFMPNPDGTPDTSRPAPTDPRGFPGSDFSVLVGTVYDPGVYHLELVTPQQPTVQAVGFSGAITETAWTPSTGHSSWTINVAPQTSDTQQLGLAVTHTGGGAQGIQLIRPGYDPARHPLFTRTFLRFLRINNPNVLRFMDWRSTIGSVEAHWGERALPGDARQGQVITRTVSTTTGPRRVTASVGVSWEYCIALANALHKDMWITVPLLADDDYVVHLAHLISSRLNRRLSVYVEYTNEAWNPLFLQYSMNRALALTQAAQPGSILGFDGQSDPSVLAQRRFAQRTVQVARTFARAFHPGSLHRRVRPVLAYQFSEPGRFEDMLRFISEFYGAPRRFLDGIAVSDYFYIDGADHRTDLSANDVLAALAQSAASIQSGPLLPELVTEARFFRLGLFAYEGGVDTIGEHNNFAAKVAATRDPRIADIIRRHMRAWYAAGGGQFNWLTVGASAFSPFGTFPLTDSVRDLGQPKELAYRDVRRGRPPPVTVGTMLPAALDARKTVQALDPVVTPYVRGIAAGSRLDYLVRAPRGNRRFKLRVVAGNSTAAHRLGVWVDGVQAGNPMVPATGVGATGYTPTVPLRLTAGQHLISLVVPSAQPYDIDSVQIAHRLDRLVALPHVEGLAFSQPVALSSGGTFADDIVVSDPNQTPDRLTVAADTNVPDVTVSVGAVAGQPGRWHYVVHSGGSFQGTARVFLDVSAPDGGFREVAFDVSIS